MKVEDLYLIETLQVLLLFVVIVSVTMEPFQGNVQEFLLS